MCALAPLSELPPIRFVHIYSKVLRCLFDVGKSEAAFLIGDAFYLVETGQCVPYMACIGERFSADKGRRTRYPVGPIASSTCRVSCAAARLPLRTFVRAFFRLPAIR
jgi:hypothetical protein